MTTKAATRHATDTEVFNLALRTYGHHKHLGHGKANEATMAWAMLYVATWRKPEILAGPLQLDRLASGVDEPIIVWTQAYALDRRIDAENTTGVFRWLCLSREPGLTVRCATAWAKLGDPFEIDAAGTAYMA